MKKLVFPLLIAFLLLASVSPVFAKGKGPNFGHDKGQGTQLLQQGTEIEDPEGTETPEGTEMPDEDEAQAPNTQHGKSGQHGNPHGDKLVRKNGNANKGSNFVLFGKVESLADGMISVKVESGNSVAKDFIDQPAITIIVDKDYTVIRVMDDNPSERKAITDIPVGANVRIHGWLAKGDATAQEPTPDTWTARQINVLPAVEGEETTVPQG